MIASGAIAVAAATPTVFDLAVSRDKVGVMVVFYGAAGAALGDVVSGGTRDIAVSAVEHVNDYGQVVAPIADAAVTANPGGTLKVLDLGVPRGRISVACAAASTPGGATHYRIFVG